MTPETMAWIEQQKPTLVVWAEEFVKDSKLYTRYKKSNRAQVSRNQLRNLLNAAMAGASIKELINFLHYQVGRKNEAWKHWDSADQLESLLLGQLASLAEKSKPIIEKSQQSIYEMEASLAAQLMGFIIREYTYRCKLERTSS